MVREKKSLELLGWLRIGGRARTLHFPDTLGRMNLGHRLNAIGTFSKVMGTIVDIAFYVNEKLISINRLRFIKTTIRGTTIPLYVFAGKQPKKEHKVGVNFLGEKLSASRDGP